MVSTLKQRVLITGVTGLIGGQLLPVLASKYDVWAIVRSPIPTDENTAINWIKYDLTDASLPDSLPDKIDIVIHLAQSPHFREFPDKAKHVFGVNVESTMRLLDWARRAGAHKFIYASSGGIYGYGDRDFKENDVIDRTQPLGFYLASKQCAELLVESYSNSFSIAILRFFFVYGETQRKTMLIPSLINSVIAGKALQLQGQEGIRINPIYVDDAVEAIDKSIMLKESMKINIGGSESVTLRQIGDIIGHHLGKDAVYEIQEDAAPRHLVGDIGVMKKYLVEPRVTLFDGIKRLVDALG